VKLRRKPASDERSFSVLAIYGCDVWEGRRTEKCSPPKAVQNEHYNIAQYGKFAGLVSAECVYKSGEKASTFAVEMDWNDVKACIEVFADEGHTEALAIQQGDMGMDKLEVGFEIRAAYKKRIKADNKVHDLLVDYGLTNEEITQLWKAWNSSDDYKPNDFATLAVHMVCKTRQQEPEPAEQEEAAE
jgi:hypothetical protein